MANCGWTGAGAIFSLSFPAMARHEISSRSVSRPGSTTAPRGSCAIAASNFAVAGIEPVDPAAITGSLLLARRSHFGVDELVASFGGIDRADFLQALRPIVACDLQEFEGLLPILIELVGHQPIELLPIHLGV